MIQASYDRAYSSLQEYERLKVQYNELKSSNSLLQEQLNKEQEHQKLNQVGH
jgi:hypothetical protein